MESRAKNIFIFGADEFNLALIRALDTEHRYQRHSPYTYEKMRMDDTFPVRELSQGPWASYGQNP